MASTAFRPPSAQPQYQPPPQPGYQPVSQPQYQPVSQPQFQSAPPAVSNNIIAPFSLFKILFVYILWLYNVFEEILRST